LGFGLRHWIAAFQCLLKNIERCVIHPWFILGDAPVKQAYRWKEYLFRLEFCLFCSVLKHRKRSDTTKPPIEGTSSSEPSSESFCCGSVYSARRKFLMTYFEKVRSTFLDLPPSYTQYCPQLKSAGPGCIKGVYGG
jgi:hypothetical protein